MRTAFIIRLLCCLRDVHNIPAHFGMVHSTSAVTVITSYEAIGRPGQLSLCMHVSCAKQCIVCMSTGLSNQVVQNVELAGQLSCIHSARVGMSGHMHMQSDWPLLHGHPNQPATLALLNTLGSVKSGGGCAAYIVDAVQALCLQSARLACGLTRRLDGPR